MRLQKKRVLEKIGTQKRPTPTVSTTSVSSGPRKTARLYRRSISIGWAQKSFPRCRVSISLSENNGIYLPIRQLGRLKGRRVAPATETLAYRESGLHGPVQSVWRAYTYRG